MAADFLTNYADFLANYADYEAISLDSSTDLSANFLSQKRLLALALPVNTIGIDSFSKEALTLESLGVASNYPQEFEASEGLFGYSEGQILIGREPFRQVDFL